MSEFKVPGMRFATASDEWGKTFLFTIRPDDWVKTYEQRLFSNGQWDWAEPLSPAECHEGRLRHFTPFLEALVYSLDWKDEMIPCPQRTKEPNDA